jgi:hypothetical protein
MLRYCAIVAAQCCNATHFQYCDVTQSRNHNKQVHSMKKNRDSSELAARIAAAASQPAGASARPTPVLASSHPPVAVMPAAPPTPARPKSKKARLNEQDTVAITLRPKSALWNKYVIKASERTREEGRVVSAQQMMLETLERVEL